MTDQLAARQLTYAPVGITADNDSWRAVQGFRRYEESAQIGEGSERWEFASRAVLTWGVKTRSGFALMAASGRPADAQGVAVADRVWLVARIGPLRVREPVQVVALIDEPDRRGFAYGTLTGHPLRGEEAFVVQRLPDGSVWITVRSMTRPPEGIGLLAYPAVVLAQRSYRRRYLRALAGPM